MIVHSSGRAVYEKRVVKRIENATSASPVQRSVIKKRAPWFNEFLLFDDVLRQITTPNDDILHKRRLGERLGGWLFNNQD
jgi:hypothetical protein